MAERGDEPRPPETTRLDYQTPVAEPRGDPGMAIIGFLAGAALWFAIAAGLGTAIWSPVPNRTVGYAKYGAAGLMLVVAVSAVVLIAKVRKRRFFWLGFMIGSAIMGLIQGICFINL